MKRIIIVLLLLTAIIAAICGAAFLFKDSKDPDATNALETHTLTSPTTTHSITIQDVTTEIEHTEGIETETTIPTETTSTHEETASLKKLDVIASGFVGVYDGTAHSITVNCAEADVTYSVSVEGTYAAELPTFVDAGTHTIYYKVQKDGYETVFDSETVVIQKAPGKVMLSAENGTLTYPSFTTFSIIDNLSAGILTIKVSNDKIVTATIDGNTVTLESGVIGGTAIVTVISSSTANYEEAFATYTVIVQNGELNVTAESYEGIYDATPHSIEVICPNAQITYSESEGGIYSTTKPQYTNAGVYTVYYRVEKSGYRTVTGSKTVTINKAAGSITLTNNSGILTYPSSGTFSVKENLSSGTLSVKSSDTNIVTVSIKDNKITITPVSVGTATISVISAETANYTEALASYTVTVKAGTLKVTATPYSGTYDGKSHGITVSCPGADISYSSSRDGSYTSKCPVYTNEGVYTTYYKVSKNGYETVFGSETVTIIKVSNKFELSEKQTSLTVSVNSDMTIRILNKRPGATVTVESDKPHIVSVVINGDEIIIKAHRNGEARISVTSSTPSPNFSIATVVYYVTVEQEKPNVVSSSYEGVYDGLPHSISVSCPGATITYSVSVNGVYTSQTPGFVDAGTYFVYYKVEKSGYETFCGKESVVINPISGFIVLPDDIGSLVDNNSISFNIDANIPGAFFTVESSNPDIVSVSVDGNTVTLTNGSVKGTAIIKIETTPPIINYIVAETSFTISNTPYSTYAVYSEDDNSLRFYYTDSTIKRGTRYNGLIATEVYTGFDGSNFMVSSDVPWYNIRSLIKTVVIEDEFSPISIAYWFNNLSHCANINVSLLDTQNVVSMKYAFYNTGAFCSSFSIVGIQNWNTSHVLDMSHMFEGAAAKSSVFDVDLSRWDVSAVTNMASMFCSTASKAQVWSVGNIANWDVSSVENMVSMFSRAGRKASYTLDLRKWNVSMVFRHEYFSNEVTSKIISPIWVQ